MSPLSCRLLGVLSFVPTAGVLGIAIVATVLTQGRPDQVVDIGPIAQPVPGFTVDEAIALGIATVVLAFVQMGVAIPLIFHARANPQLREPQKILWTVLVVFLGSICAPMYWVSHVRRSS